MTDALEIAKNRLDQHADIQGYVLDTPCDCDECIVCRALIQAIKERDEARDRAITAESAAAQWEESRLDPVLADLAQARSRVEELEERSSRYLSDIGKVVEKSQKYWHEAVDAKRYVRRLHGVVDRWVARFNDSQRLIATLQAENERLREALEKCKAIAMDTLNPDMADRLDRIWQALSPQPSQESERAEPDFDKLYLCDDTGCSRCSLGMPCHTEPQESERVPCGHVGRACTVQVPHPKRKPVIPTIIPTDHCYRREDGSNPANSPEHDGPCIFDCFFDSDGVVWPRCPGYITAPTQSQEARRCPKCGKSVPGGPLPPGFSEPPCDDCMPKRERHA